MNLDFAGVSEKMKQMAVVSKSMTFKETLGGLKNMASGLASLGKAILANPLFLMVGVIVGIVGALKLWSDSVNEKAVKAQEKHALSIQKTMDKAIESQKIYDKIASLEIKRAELDNASADEIGKIKLKNLENQHKHEEFLINESYKKRVVLRGLANKADTEEKRAEYEQQINDLKANEKELSISYRSFNLEKTNLEIETNQNIEDENKAHNEN